MESFNKTIAMINEIANRIVEVSNNTVKFNKKSLDGLAKTTYFFVLGKKINTIEELKQFIIKNIKKCEA